MTQNQGMDYWSEDQKKVVLDLLLSDLRSAREQLTASQETVEDLSTKNMQLSVELSSVARQLFDDLESVQETNAHLQKRIDTALALIDHMSKMAWGVHTETSLQSIRAVLTDDPAADIAC